MERRDDYLEASWTSETHGNVIFSLVDGNVWASWPDSSAAIKLGSYYQVSTCMRDFLAQSALGDQLISAIPLSE
jgi:hypothetical protein